MEQKGKIQNTHGHKSQLQNKMHLTQNENLPEHSTVLRGMTKFSEGGAKGDNSWSE
jgi:hypothetical protein